MNFNITNFLEFWVDLVRNSGSGGNYKTLYEWGNGILFFDTWMKDEDLIDFRSNPNEIEHTYTEEIQQFKQYRKNENTKFHFLCVTMPENIGL